MVTYVNLLTLRGSLRTFLKAFCLCSLCPVLFHTCRFSLCVEITPLCPSHWGCAAGSFQETFCFSFLSDSGFCYEILLQVIKEEAHFLSESTRKVL